MFPIAILHGTDDSLAQLQDIFIFQAPWDDYGNPALTTDHNAVNSIDDQLFGTKDKKVKLIETPDKSYVTRRSR